MKKSVIAGIIRSGLKVTKVKHSSGLMLILVSKAADATTPATLKKKQLN